MAGGGHWPGITALLRTGQASSVTASSAERAFPFPHQSQTPVAHTAPSSVGIYRYIGVDAMQRLLSGTVGRPVDSGVRPTPGLPAHTLTQTGTGRHRQTHVDITD